MPPVGQVSAKIEDEPSEDTAADRVLFPPPPVV